MAPNPQTPTSSEQPPAPYTLRLPRPGEKVVSLLSLPASGNLHSTEDGKYLGFFQIPVGTQLGLEIKGCVEAHWHQVEQFWTFLVDVGQEQPIEVLPVSMNPDGSATYEPTVAIELSAAT